MASVTEPLTAVERALREADDLLEESEKTLKPLTATQTLRRLQKQEREASEASSESQDDEPEPLKTLEEEEEEKRADLAARMRKCKNRNDIVKVLETCRSQGLVADTRMVNGALSALAKSAQLLRTRDSAGTKAASESVEMAKKLIAELGEHSSGRGLHNSMLYETNSVTYSTFISLLARAAAAGANNVDLDDGLAALASMRSRLCVCVSCMYVCVSRVYGE
jgi:hypothetical protein